MSEYDKIADRATASSHLIELYDTDRVAIRLWRCIKCARKDRLAIGLTR